MFIEPKMHFKVIVKLVKCLLDASKERQSA